MRLAVVIPTRDRPQPLARALASVMAQEPVVDQVVVVDDGCDDHTAAMVQREFPAVRLVRTPGLGPGPARNRGVAATDGDIVFFLDDDDYWLPGHVQGMLAVFRRGYDAAYATVVNHDQVDGGSFCIPAPGEAAEGEVFHALCRWCFLVPSGFALRRRVFRAAGGFADLEMAEDWEFFCRLARQHSFGFAGPTPTVVRTLHRASRCARVDRRRLLAGLRALTPFAPQRFRRLARFTADHPQGFSTIQHWYRELGRAGLLGPVFPEDHPHDP